MRRLLWTSVLVFLVACGTAARMKRLTPREKDHYYALKVWMSEDQRKDYLRLKTEPERDAWLKENGLWERFYKYDEAMREAILAGDVQVGFDQEAVFMSWGEPHQRSRLPGRRATRSELLTYRFEVDAEGYVYVWRTDSNETYKAVDFYRMEVVVDDGVVAELNKRDGWD